MSSDNSPVSTKLVGSLVRLLEPNNKTSQLKWHRSIVLMLTFFAYMVYHMSRRPISVVSNQLNGNCHESHDNTLQLNSSECIPGWEPFNTKNGETYLGLLDTFYLFTYAIVMFGSGYVAERSNLRYFLSINLAICGLMCITFGLARAGNIHQLYYFIIIQVVTGVFQTSGWPAVVAVIGSWYGHTKKGLIFGIWNWHTSVGNIVGAALAGKQVAFKCAHY